MLNVQFRDIGHWTLDIAQLSQRWPGGSFRTWGAVRITPGSEDNLGPAEKEIDHASYAVA
jgi:hypothetical protein